MGTRYTTAGDGFEVHFNLISGVLRAQVEGPHDSYSISIAYWRVIANERLQTGARCILVIENLADSTSSDVTLSMADALLELGFEGCRVAFVDSGTVNVSAQEHIAIMARERGIVAAVFSQEAEALNWLRHGEE